MKLWGGRFRSEENKLMEEFNKSFGFDSLLYKKDIEGSLAHVYMQVQVNLLTREEGEIIINGLKSIEKDIEEGKLLLEGNYEDIHSFIEINLIDRVGDVGKKLHTGRSRNDQVAVDMRLFAKDKCREIINYVEKLKSTLKEVAYNNPIIMQVILIFKEHK